MKKNNLAKFMIFALIVSIFSCDADDQAEVLNDRDTAGALVVVNATTNSSILGNPEPGVDLADAEVSITNAYLNMTVKLTSGSLADIANVQIVKSYNGGQESVAAESTTLPLSLVIDNIDDLLAGTGVTESDLRIGGVLALRTKITQTDGNVYYYNNSMGNYNLIVNCSSDLAGNYSNPNMPFVCGVGTDPVVVTQESPGRYLVSSMPTYSFGAGNCISWYMIDTCGTLTYDGGDLEDNNYSGAGGTGIVNADGSFTFTNFLIDAGSGLNYSIETTYTPVP
ncbi:hypothetical protein [Bizionia arctica]|nr:hypothetical protein [Bizionia arctica]